MGEKKGISLNYLFSYIGKKKWLSIGLVAGITLVSALGLYGYRKLATGYEGEFIVKWDGIENEVYPDNTAFDYHEVVSSDAINYVIQSNESFSKLDADKIVEENKIIVSNEKEYDTGVLTDNVYKIEIESGVFFNKKQAVTFAKELLNYYKDNVVGERKYIASVDNSLSNITATTEYKEVFSLIESQFDSLDEVYENLVKTNFDISHANKNGKSISSVYGECQALLAKYESSYISQSYLENGYVRNVDSAKESAPTELKAVNAQLTYEQNVVDALINKLQNVDFTVDDYIGQILIYVKDIESLKIQKNYYETVAASPVYNKSYDDEVTGYVNELVQISNDFKEVVSDNKNETINVRFANIAVLEDVTPFSAITMVGGAVIIGVLVTFIVMFALANKDFSKNPAVTENKE